jgi:hypothetical protein
MESTTFTADLRTQFDAFLDEHRTALNSCLDGLSEQEARASLVPSRTTLLGLVKHATFVEKVWFDEAITGRSRQEIGIPASPDESFILTGEDTVPRLRAAHSQAWSPVTGAVRCRFGGSTCTCSGNWPSIAVTRTFCASRSSLHAPDGAGRILQVEA